MTSFKTVVEIGCHYQNTVLNMPQCDSATVWMIDAVQELLDLTPDRENVHKICCAVTAEYTGKGNMRGILRSTQKEKNLPEWSTQMGSLKETHHPTISNFKWDDYTSEFEVDCYSVKDFWNTFNIPKHVDFLSTDLEGLDYSVLCSLFKNEISCNLLRFESKLMSGREIMEIKDLLLNQGYTTIIPGNKLDYMGNPFNHYAYKNIEPNIDFAYV